MKIIDVSTKGILPFKEKKVILKSNFNFVYGENGKGKTTLLKCILAALFEEGWKELKDDFHFVETEPPRIAVTFRSEKEAYRVTRDVSTGMFVLYRYDFQKKGFVEESRDSFILSSLLEEKFHLLPYHLYKPLYTLSHETITSKTKKITDIVTPTSSQVSAPSEDIKRRKEELLKELELAREIEKLEDRLNDKERELFTVKQQIENRESLREEIKFMEEELENKKILEEFADTAQDKLSQFKKLTSEKEKLESTEKPRIDRLKEELEEVGEFNPLGNKMLKTGAILFIVSILLLIFRNILGSLTKVSFISSLLPFVLLPVMVGSIVAIFYALFKEASKKGKREKLEKEVKELEYRYRKASERIELEIKKIETIMNTLNIHSPDEFGERIREYRELKQEVEDKKKKLTEEEKTLPDKELEAKKEELEKEIENLKKELETKGSPSMAIHEIEDELRMIEDQSYQSPVPTPQPESVEEETQIETFLETLAEHSGTTSEEAISNLYDIMIPLLKNTLGKDYDTFTFQDGIPGLRRADGEFLPLDKLSDSTQDAILIILLLSSVKYNSEFRKIPLILDDPFLTQDDKRKQTLFSALKELSQYTQIIMFSRNKEGKELADTFITL